MQCHHHSRQDLVEAVASPEEAAGGGGRWWWWRKVKLPLFFTVFVELLLKKSIYDNIQILLIKLLKEGIKKYDKKLPYGISNYEELVEDNYYYVDKTRYIEMLENLAEKRIM